MISRSASSRRRRLAGALALLPIPLLTGCASLPAYRPDPLLLQSRFATIEHYGTEPLDPAQVDRLLAEVATLLGVRLDPALPALRIVVTHPARIAQLSRRAAASFPEHTRAAALYFPRANLILIPSFDRTLLGHELAHYLTEHALKAPRSRWEEIARDVERKLTTPQR